MSTGLLRSDSARFVLCGHIRSYTKGVLWDLLSLLPAPAVFADLCACIYTTSVHVCIAAPSVLHFISALLKQCLIPVKH